MLRIIFLLFFLILTSCVKYVDAVYDSSKTHERVLLAKFPIKPNDKNNQRALETCRQFVKIQDSACIFKENKITCQPSVVTKSSSYCIINGNKVD